ncbi:hypothetical protein [Parafilimonas sp.]|uniref:hypothetical protein n=1 Tax=Parafilimonas sp. TaxID=1969739 RepID=UPI003F7D26B9
MTSKAKLFIAILIFLFFLIGLITGLIWKDIPYIKLNHEVKVTECLSIIVTLGIGIFIPLIVKKWIDDARSVKTYLVDELNSVLSTVNLIKLKIKESFDKGTIGKDEKDEINYLFHTAELQITSFKNQLKVAFPNQEKKLSQKLSETYNLYKDFLTDGPLMVSSFTKIDDRFYREHNQESMKLDSLFKTIIQQIYKF